MFNRVKYCLTTFIVLYNRNYAAYIGNVRVFPIEKLVAWEAVWDIRRRNKVDVAKLLYW